MTHDSDAKLSTRIDELEVEVAKLNEQLDAEHNIRTQWRDQWCKDGHEIANLREQLRNFVSATPGTS